MREVTITEFYQVINPQDSVVSSELIRDESGRAIGAESTFKLRTGGVLGISRDIFQVEKTYFLKGV